MKASVFIWERDPLQAQVWLRLYQQAGFETLWVNSFAELKRAVLAVKHQPSLVICSSDQIMAETRHFKTLLKLAPLAMVVALIRRQDLQTRLAVMQAGVTVSLDHMIQNEALIAQSQTLLHHSLKLLKYAKTVKYTSSHLRFGQWVLNRQHFRVEIGSQGIVLKPRAFELLTYFCQHPNQLLSRDELHQALWQTQQHPGSRHLDNLILYLRAHLSGHADFDLITVYKLGYIFRLESQS